MEGLSPIEFMAKRLVTNWEKPHYSNGGRACRRTDLGNSTSKWTHICAVALSPAQHLCKDPRSHRLPTLTPQWYHPQWSTTHSPTARPALEVEPGSTFWLAQSHHVSRGSDAKKANTGLGSVMFSDEKPPCNLAGFRRSALFGVKVPELVSPNDAL